MSICTIQFFRNNIVKEFSDRLWQSSCRSTYLKKLILTGDNSTQKFSQPVKLFKHVFRIINELIAEKRVISWYSSKYLFYCFENIMSIQNDDSLLSFISATFLSLFLPRPMKYPNVTRKQAYLLKWILWKMQEVYGWYSQLQKIRRKDLDILAYNYPSIASTINSLAEKK